MSIRISELKQTFNRIFPQFYPWLSTNIRSCKIFWANLASLSEEQSDLGDLDKARQENLDRAAALGRIDLREHNANYRAPSFSNVISQSVTSEQFKHHDYLHWAEQLGFGETVESVISGTSETTFNRKIWEWAYVLQAALKHGRLQPGMTAVGFGVGNEPVPAVLAKHGMSVIATDQEAADTSDYKATGQWANTGQLLTGLGGLFRPSLISNDRLAELVKVRSVDMNEVPGDLAPCDLVWSSCALEHLGSPEKGLEFILASARLLAPDGIAVHTTELDLTGRSSTVDWGHLACYRPADFRWLAKEAALEGFEMELNFSIPLDTPEDRWVSMVLRHGPDLAVGELSHLKVEMFESVCTSFGVILRRLR